MDHDRHPASQRIWFPYADTAKALLVRTPVGSGFHEPSLGEAPGLAFRGIIPRAALAMPIWTGFQEQSANPLPPHKPTPFPTHN
jgi:hypothetical protein